MGKGAIIIAIIVSLLAGGAGGYVMGSSGEGARLAAARAQGAVEGRQETERRLNEKFVAAGISSPLDKPMTDVYGFVESASSDGFTIKYDAAQFSVVETGIMTKRVTVSSATSILKQVQKSITPDEIKAELAAGKSGGGGGITLFDGPQPGTVPQDPKAPPAKPPATPAAPATDGKVGTTFEEPAAMGDVIAGTYVHLTLSNDARTADVLEAVRVVLYDRQLLPPDAGADPTKLPFGRGNVINLDVPYIPTQPAE